MPQQILKLACQILLTHFGWVFLLPHNPPKKIIDQMNESIIKIMKEPQIVAQLNKLGAEPALMSPQKFDQMVKMEMDSAAILVKESKMAVN